MGGSVSIENHTPYYWSYCYSYKGTSPYLKGSGTLSPSDRRHQHKQEAFHSYIYVKYGCHDKETCHRYKDLRYEYYAARNPTFKIRESSDRSCILLECTTESYVPSCPNYGRQEELRQQQQQEEQRRREEQQRREEQRRREEQEERRRLERLERERRIEEEVERENEASESRLARVSEKLKQKLDFRGQERHVQRSHILQQLVEDDAAAIQVDELEYIEKKLNKLLGRYAIKEDQSLQSSHIEDRMKTLQNELTAQYCREHQLPVWSQFAFDSAIRYEHLSLTEKFCVLEAVIQLILGEDSDILTETELQDHAEYDSFLFGLLVQVYQRNATLAGNLVLSILEMFLELSEESKELLSQILFSKIWTPMEMVTFARLTVGAPQDQVASVLRKTQTYRLDLLTVLSALKDEDPVKFLQTYSEEEEDKDLSSILEEMRASNYPEPLLSIIEIVLGNVMEELPKYTHFDLDDKMKSDGIAMVKSLDFTNPDPKTLTQVLIGLSIAVQDTSTIYKDDKKIEGYFPRVTQLASLLMLLLSKRMSDNGCLLEIGTGEGKSCILAMFATIQAIRGIKVDVVTSSPVLARRDQEEWQKLYKMFDISSSVVPPVGINSYDNSRQREASITEAYAKQIVYGTVGNFAADILKQEFEKTQTRGERRFDLVIVDEVDYMTLDNGVQVTFLSHEASGLRHAEQVLAWIWQMICTCQPIILAETGEVQWATKIQHFHRAASTAVMGSSTSEHFSPLNILEPGLQLGFFTQEDIDKVQAAEMEGQKENAPVESKDPNFQVLQIIMGKIGVAQQHDLLRVFEEVLEKAVSFECYTTVEGRVVPFGGQNPDCDEKIRMLLLEGGHACEIVSQEQIIKATVEELRSRIKYSDTYVSPSQSSESDSFILIPFFLRDYMENRLPVFVENGLRAISMTQDREYMIDFGSEEAKSALETEKHRYHVIIPVDFKASGVLEKNKRWGDGLQQFLEMKHQLAITSLSNVTNYLSNFHYFQRYLKGTGIFGVSGTLGSKADKQFLCKQYKTESYVVPAHRHKKVVELPALQVKGGKGRWMETICECVQMITRRGQVALVICEDVKTSEELRQIMTTSAPLHRITMYTISEKHNIEKMEFSAGCVIIATNLGGRGTDIKVDKGVNASGGLCVILTHFPSSRRVEKQVFGRTARKGNPGMVQMVLNHDSLAAAYQGQPLEIMRQLREEYEVDRITDMETDELLEIQTREELFACFCAHLSSFEQRYTEEEKLHLVEKKEIPSFYTMDQKLDYHPALNALKEAWALWLTLHEKQIDKHMDVGQLKSELSLMLQHTANELLQGISSNFYDHIKQAVTRMDLHARNKKLDYGAFDYWQRVIDTDKVFQAVSKYNQAYITINMEGDSYKKKAMDLLRDAESAIQVHVSETTNTMAACRLSCLAPFTPHHTDGTNFQVQMETRLSVYSSWKVNISKAIEKLEELEKKRDEAQTEVSAVYMLLDEKDYIITTELMALYEYGLGIVFEVKKKPKFCIDGLICAILGACQVFLGALVCALSFGTASQVGLGLISEGISDMIEGIKGMITGSFDWAEWAISKSISIGMSLVTAGFSLARKAVTSVYTATNGLLTGTKTFASITDDIVRSGKSMLTSVKGTAKATVSSLSKDTMKKSLHNLASSKTMTSSFKEAGKYAMQELGMETFNASLNYTINKGLQAVFKDILSKAFTDIITKAIEDNTALDQCLTQVIVLYGVPKEALQKDPNSSMFKLREDIRKKLRNILLKVCNDNLSDLMDDHAVLNEVINRVSEVHEKATELIQKARVPGAVQTVIKISVIITEKTSQFVQMVQSFPTESIIHNTFVPKFNKSIEEQFAEENWAEYEKDGRCGFPVVAELKTEFKRMISDNLLSTFLDAFTGHLTSMTSTFRKKLNKAAGGAVGNLLGRFQTQRFFSDQKHIQDMKRSFQGPERALAEAEAREMARYVEKISEVSRPANIVDLLALTRSDLMEGKGIQLTIVDERGKRISDMKFAGKNSAAGDIILRLTKDQELHESDKGFIAKIKDRISGKENPFTGHFDIVQSDGKVIPVRSENQNCLYHAVIQAKGNRQEDKIKYEATKLRNQVKDEVLGNLNRYAGIVKLQQGYDQIYSGTGKYTIEGGCKRKRDDNDDREHGEWIAALQKTVKKKDGFHLARNLKLGITGKYKNIRRENKNNMRDSPQHVTEVDHIPPKAVLQKALQKVQQDSQGNAELRRRNPKLHAMLMGTDTDSYAREMLCMNTLRQDHRAALTTGNSVESQRCRDQLIQTLLSGDAEKLLKKSFIVAHPISSKQLKQDTGLNPCGIKERRNKAFAETTKAYYLIGFSKLVDRYYKDYGIIDQNQKDSLLAWVEKERHLDVNTKEYKELLTAIKEDY